jgi:hypothetical protein
MKSKYPGIASMAAQIEMFGLSKREIERKFCRSELVLLAWRSQEISASLEQQSPESDSNIPKKKRKYSDASIPDGLPDHFYNESGEVDLRLVTGEEAYKYLSAVGMKLPIMQGSRKG